MIQSPISVTSLVSNISVNGANDGSISVVHLEELLLILIHGLDQMDFLVLLLLLVTFHLVFIQSLVTDLYGCTYDEQFTINEPNCNVIIDTTYYPPLCFNDNTQELTWLNSGGLAPYTSELTDEMAITGMVLTVV